MLDKLPSCVLGDIALSLRPIDRDALAVCLPLPEHILCRVTHEKKMEKVFDVIRSMIMFKVDREATFRVSCGFVWRYTTDDVITAFGYEMDSLGPLRTNDQGYHTATTMPWSLRFSRTTWSKYEASPGEFRMSHSIVTHPDDKQIASSSYIIKTNRGYYNRYALCYLHADAINHIEEYFAKIIESRYDDGSDRKVLMFREIPQLEYHCYYTTRLLLTLLP